MPKNRKLLFDGSEIRRSPVEVGSLSHYLQGFRTIQTVIKLAGFYQLILLRNLESNNLTASGGVTWFFVKAEGTRCIMGSQPLVFERGIFCSTLNFKQ